MDSRGRSTLKAPVELVCTTRSGRAVKTPERWTPEEIPTRRTRSRSRSCGPSKSPAPSPSRRPRTPVRRCRSPAMPGLPIEIPMTDEERERLRDGLPILRESSELPPKLLLYGQFPEPEAFHEANVLNPLVEPNAELIPDVAPVPANILEPENKVQDEISKGLRRSGRVIKTPARYFPETRTRSRSRAPSKSPGPSRSTSANSCRSRKRSKVNNNDGKPAAVSPVSSLERGPIAQGPAYQQPAVVQEGPSLPRTVPPPPPLGPRSKSAVTPRGAPVASPPLDAYEIDPEKISDAKHWQRLVENAKVYCMMNSEAGSFATRSIFAPAASVQNSAPANYQPRPDVTKQRSSQRRARSADRSHGEGAATSDSPGPSVTSTPKPKSRTKSQEPKMTDRSPAANRRAPRPQLYADYQLSPEALEALKRRESTAPWAVASAKEQGVQGKAAAKPGSSSRQQRKRKRSPTPNLRN